MSHCIGDPNFFSKLQRMLLSVLFLLCKLSVQKLFWSEKFAANINLVFQ